MSSRVSVGNLLCVHGALVLESNEGQKVMWACEVTFTSDCKVGSCKLTCEINLHGKSRYVNMYNRSLDRFKVFILYNNEPVQQGISGCLPISAWVLKLCPNSGGHCRPLCLPAVPAVTTASQKPGSHYLATLTTCNFPLNSFCIFAVYCWTELS